MRAACVPCIRPSVLFVPALGVLAACRADSGLTKHNAEPEAQVTAPSDGDAVLEGTTLALRGAASDPDDVTTDLSARWFLGDAEACGAATPAADGTTTCEVPVPAADTITVRLEVIDPDGAAGTDTVTLAVTPNADPLAAITSPDGAARLYSDQLVTFRGTVSDAEDAPEALTVWWEDGAERLDAVEAVPNGSGEVLGYAPLSEGPHALELHVLDSAGNEAIDTVLVDVGPPNSAPDCAVTAPADGGASAEGARVDLAALVGDADVAADTLLVEWSSDRDGLLGSSTPESDGTVVFSTSALSRATHRLTVRVTDEMGASCTDGISYTVGSPPAIELELPLLDEVVNEGDPLTFSALVSDAEDPAGELWVTWESDLDGVFAEGPPDSTGVAQLLESGLSVGAHALTVTVTDTAGLYATALGTFVVNGLPSAPVVTITPASPDTDDDLRANLASAAVDPDGDPVAYTYAWSVDGVLSSASLSSTLPASATTRGEVWTVSVTATDGLGTGAVGTASVTIANSAPDLASVSVSPSSAEAGDVLTCTATATDPDGGTPTVTYAWSGGATGATYTVSAADAPGDVITCTATATDADGAIDVGTASATVVNTAPVVTSVTVSPSSGRVGDVLVCAGTAADADGGTPALSYAWSNGATGASLTIAGSDDPGDVLTCTVTATDADGGTGVGSASAAVLNTAPVMGTVSISPASAYNDDTLACAASASDADGGSASFAYAWTNVTTGAGLGSGASLALNSALAASGDTLRCAATASDADGGAAASSATVTLGNRAPSASASLTPASPLRGSTLTCAGGGADVDDDAVSLSFAWTVGGTSVSASGGTATTSTLSSGFTAGDTVRCTVTALDGKGGSGSASDSVTIGNTAPVAASVALSPDPAYTNDTLTASATVSDADGDALGLTYEWFVDGVSVQRGASATLAGTAWFGRDDEVVVEVTVDDGAATDTVSSGALTISNSAPSTPTVGITPADPSAGDDLTCAVTGASADVDGDAVTYAFAWDADGVDYTDATDGLTSSVVDGIDVAAEQTWTCEVTADDGTDLSGVASASVTTSCLLGSESGCAATSCLEILDAGASTGDGLYWLDPLGTGAVQASCDMTTDGGGWTRIFGINISGSSAIATGGTTVNAGLVAAAAGTGHITNASLDSFRSATGFSELRFWCRKPSVGRTISIVADSTDVLDYFSNRRTSFPTATGSFRRLSDDTSQVSLSPALWGLNGGVYRVDRWGHDGVTSTDRFVNHAFFISYNNHWLLSGSRYECDDYGTYTYTGQWYIWTR